MHRAIVTRRIAGGTISRRRSYSDMFLIAIGALLVISGIVLAAVRTASRGKLSDPHATAPGTRSYTLEPLGRGRRLSIKADVPGLALMAIGALLIFAGVSF